MKKLFILASLIFGAYSVNALASTDADDPARAVEYVKACSLYGVGFHYIPGTDTCLEETTGLTKVETAYGTVEGQSELAHRVALLEAKLALLTKQLENKNKNR